MRRILLGVLAISLFFACKSKDKEPGEIEDDGIYLDYKIMAEEGNDNLVITAQFREGKQNSDAIELKGPASISFDGLPMTADSSKYSGYIYELFRPIDSFSGAHQFIYTNGKGKQREMPFVFTAPKLNTEVPDTIRRGDLELEFSGLEEKTTMRLVMIDTSFANEGLNQVTTAENGRLLIPAEAFESVDNGPVQLEMVVESARPVGTKKQGKLLLLYTFRREFFLVD